MKLTEALTGTTIACAERTAGQCHTLIQSSQRGYHLSRYIPDDSDALHHSFWTFVNLHELLGFARAQGFTEVEPEAEDWRKAF